MQKRINGIFIWSYQKNIVPLHREPALGMSAHQRRRVADIIKKAFIGACFGFLKSGKFEIAQNKKVPRFFYIYTNGAFGANCPQNIQYNEEASFAPFGRYAVCVLSVSQ